MHELLNLSQPISSPGISRVILAIETATPVCSVALFDGKGLYQLREQGSGVHSVRLGGMIHELLTHTGVSITSVESVLISSGPGSYTGLRIGTSFIKGLFYDRGVRVFRTSTLPVMAYSIARLRLSDPGQSRDLNESVRIHAILDARRHHLYHWGGEFQIRSGKVSAVNEVHSSQARELEQIEHLLKEGDYLGGFGSDRLNERILETLYDFGDKAIAADAMIYAFANPAMSLFFEEVNLASFAPDYLS